MKRILYLFLIIVFLQVLSCKKQKPEGKEAIKFNTQQEKLDSIPLLILTKNQIETIDLKTLAVMDSHSIHPVNFIDLVSIKDKFYILCKQRFYIISGKGEIKKFVLPFTINGYSLSNGILLLYNNNNVYRIGEHGRVAKLCDIKEKFNDAYLLPDLSAVIFVLKNGDKGHLSKFSLISKTYTQKLDLKDLVRLKISPFGKRIYVLTKKKLLYLNSDDLSTISKINFDSEVVDFLLTNKENRIYVFSLNPAKLIVIDRPTSKILSKTELKNPIKKKVVTENGKIIFMVSNDSLYKYETDNNMIEKTLEVKRKVDIISTTSAGSRIIIAKKGSNTLKIMDGNSLKIVKDIKIKTGLLDAVCGSVPFKPTSTESLPVSKNTVKEIPSAPIKNPSYYYTLQISSSSAKAGAKKLYTNTVKFSLPVYIDSSKTQPDKSIYKVRIGAFENRDDAEIFKNGLQETYNINSWVTQGIVETVYLINAGLPFGPHGNKKILLYYHGNIFLFENIGGVFRKTLSREIPGVQPQGVSTLLQIGNKSVLGFPISRDSILGIIWENNKYKLVRYSIP